MNRQGFCKVATPPPAPAPEGRGRSWGTPPMPPAGALPLHPADRVLFDLALSTDFANTLVNRQRGAARQGGHIEQTLSIVFDRHLSLFVWKESKPCYKHLASNGGPLSVC